MEQMAALPLNILHPVTMDRPLVHTVIIRKGIICVQPLILIKMFISKTIYFQAKVRVKREILRTKNNSGKCSIGDNLSMEWLGKELEAIIRFSQGILHHIRVRVLRIKFMGILSHLHQINTKPITHLIGHLYMSIPFTAQAL